MKKFVLVLSSLALHACNPEICARYCPNPQTISLQDTAGNPLIPLRVTDSLRVHECNSDDELKTAFVSCTENRITFDQRTTTPYALRVEATSGEVFDAEFTPKLEASGLTSKGCDCVREQKFADQTIRLMTP